MPSYEPSTWLGLIGYVIVALSAIAAVAVPAWITVHRGRKTGGDVADMKSDMAVVKDQVQNGHPQTAPALRDQVDHAVKQNYDIIGMLTAMSGQVGRLDGRFDGLEKYVEELHVRMARYEHPDRR